MASYDLPLEELRAYRPDLAEPSDLDAFWERTLAEARSHDRRAVYRPVETGLRLLETFDVEFAGFGGSPVKGWLHLPRERSERLPVVVALMDQICPPSTVFAAYNRYGGPKEIVEYAFNDHEGGGGFHEQAKLRWLARVLA